MNDWLANEGARGEVTRLLEEAGVPLEIRVLRAATRFARETDTRQLERVSDRGIPTYSGCAVRAERVVYGPDSTEADLREVDCCVTISEEYVISDWLGIQQIIEIPIECKVRKHVSMFGIRDDQTAPSELSFPTVSFLARSRLAHELSNAGIPRITSPTTAISLVEIKDGQTPNGIHKENLLYKAGASLYDFIRFTIQDEAIGSWGPVLERLVEEFAKYVESTHYYWPTVLYRWMDENIGAEECRTFLSYRHGSQNPRMFYTFWSWMPIVCLSSPIYEAIAGPMGAIDQFQEAEWLLLGLRLPGWRTMAGNQMIKRSPEAPVIATNDAGLVSVLSMARDWSLAQKEALVNADAGVIERALLETAFVQAVVGRLGPGERTYRSDLDVWDWADAWR